MAHEFVGDFRDRQNEPNILFRERFAQSMLDRMIFLRIEFLARALIGLVLGLAGTVVWFYQGGGNGPLFSALGGLACMASGILSFAARSDVGRHAGTGLAVCGYGLLWSAVLDLWRALSFSAAGHYLAYPFILVARLLPLLLGFILLIASLLLILSTTLVFLKRRQLGRD